MSLACSEFQAYKQIEFCRQTEILVLKHTNLDVICKSLDEPLKWYNEKELRKLVLRINLCDDSYHSMQILKVLVKEVRNRNIRLKQNPQIVIYISSQFINIRMLNLFEDIDTISPRMTLVIVWEDIKLIESRNMVELMKTICNKNIQYQHFFYIKQSAEYINYLKEYLINLRNENNELTRFVFKRFPIIDISYNAHFDKVGNLVSDIIDLWVNFPELNESVFLNYGELIMEFFKCKEYCYLSEFEQFQKNSFSFLEKSSFNMLVDNYRSLIINKLKENDLYKKCNYKNSPIALDNDWDFVFDSYVCQSPILAAGPVKKVNKQ